jgi:hypothetical protein
VYLVAERSGLLQISPLIAISTAGLVVRLVIATRVLRNVPESVFCRMVAILLLALGSWMLLRGGRS